VIVNARSLAAVLAVSAVLGLACACDTSSGPHVYNRMVDLGDGHQPPPPCTIEVEFSVTNALSAQVAVGGGYAVRTTLSNGKRHYSSAKVAYQPATLEWVARSFKSQTATATFRFQRLDDEQAPPRVVQLHIVKRRLAEQPCGLNEDKR
jgi:hypothetical protein